MRAFFFLCLFGCAAAHAMPTVGLTDLDGHPASLTHGKKLELVVFWATWCPECRDKLVNDLPKVNERSDVAVVTVNMDKESDRARAFVQKENIRLPVLRDEGKSLTQSLKIVAVPHWAVYRRDQKGEILVDSQDAFEWEKIKTALASAN